MITLTLNDQGKLEDRPLRRSRRHPEFGQAARKRATVGAVGLAKIHQQSDHNKRRVPLLERVQPDHHRAAIACIAAR
jgi:hypothetical protein